MSETFSSEFLHSKYSRQQMTNIIIKTSVNNRTIRQTFQALLKSQCISEGYKIPYIKHYSTNEKWSPSSHNIQLLIISPTDKREQSGPKILENILKEWSEVTSVFN